MSRSAAVETPPQQPPGDQADNSPATELVPPVSLEEYVKNFKYVPPSTPEEVTMRAEAPVPEAHEPPSPEPGSTPASEALESSTAAPVVESSTAKTAREDFSPIPVAPRKPAPLGPVEVPPVNKANHAAAPPVELRAPTPVAPAASAPPSSMPAPAISPADDVPDRLGLGSTDEIEGRKDRPRFLDIVEPSDTAPPARGGATITGPSFLGLSDAPVVPEETITEAEPSTGGGGSWRLWLTVAVLLLFAGLGIMEWRSQITQSYEGPVEIIKTKIRNLRHEKSAETTAPAEPAPSSADNAAAKPELKVEPPPAPTQSTSSNNITPPSNAADAAASVAGSSGTPAPNPQQSPAATKRSQSPPAPASSATTPPPGNANPTVSASSAPEKQTSSGNPSSEVSRKSSSPDSTVAPKRKASSQDDDQEVITRKIVPGAEEMAKANNASDSAAEAAWLWKATAKGNPDAPIRLADMYIRGTGVPRSCEQAVVLLKTAATKENARARNRLASMYASGICVQRNRVEAYRWLSAALTADPNSQWAQQNRNLIWQQMSPDERAAVEKYR